MFELSPCASPAERAILMLAALLQVVSTIVSGQRFSRGKPQASQPQPKEEQRPWYWHISRVTFRQVGVNITREDLLLCSLYTDCESIPEFIG